MIRDWFKKRPKECTAQDVRFLYLLCLGREPVDNREIAPHIGGSFFAALRLLVGRREARAMVFDRLTLGKQPPHAALGKTQCAEIAIGLKQHFRVEQPADSYGWYSLLEVAFNAPRFERAWLAHYSQQRLDTAKAGIATCRERQPADLVGRISSVNGLRCEGLALDKLAPKKAITLDFYLNGLYAGSTHASRPEHQYAEEFDGSPPFSFVHDMEVPPALRSYDRATLSIFERNSGAPLLPPRELILCPSFGTNMLQQLVSELRAVRENTAAHDEMMKVLNRIEDALPKLGQFAAFPLAQYHLLQEHFPLQPPQWLARSDVRFDILLYDTGDSAALHSSQTSIRHQSFPVASVQVVGEEGNTPTATAYIRALGRLDGTHVLFMKAGDRLALHALAWIARCIEDNTQAHIFYADYDHYELGKKTFQKPCFLQSFDYDMLVQHNPFGRAFAAEREQLLSLGIFDENTGHAFHQYVLLRHYEMFGATAFHHIPHVLWHMETPSATTLDIQERQEDQIRVCVSHLQRQGIEAHVRLHADNYSTSLPEVVHVDWPLDEKKPKLAIMIPTKDRLDLIKPCVESLLNTLSHSQETEIIIIDNGSSDASLLQWFKHVQGTDGIHIIRADTPFNWAALNNLAVKSTDAAYLLFLNDDTLALDQGWDTRLRQQLAREEVGAVGARLLYRNGTIQHAGMIFYDLDDARHEGAGATCDAPHPLNRTRIAHACASVTGAFLACRRDIFDEMGGFDEQFAVTFNDVDFCFRIRDVGKTILCDPAITFQHFQSESRGSKNVSEEKAQRAKEEAALMQTKWQAHFKGDPFYPKAFARSGAPFSRLAPPSLTDT